jgi:protein SCO1/2
MLRVLVVALVLLVAAMMLMPRPGPQTAIMLDAPRELPDVALIDHNGEPLRIAALSGRPTLLFFGFTNCPDICPLTLAVIAEATGVLREKIGPLAPQVLFVSVDPDRDTPEQIARYTSAFDPEFIGATADDATLEPLLSALGVTVHRETRNGETWRVTHNGTVYVLDRQGRWAGLFGGSAQVDDMLKSETLVSDFIAMRRAL